jgi:uncharacterized protein YraI
MIRYRSGGDGSGRFPSPFAHQTANGMQHLVAIATALLILVGSVAMIPVSASASAADGVSTIDDLNLRTEPALNAGILNVMPAGAGVAITGDPVNGFYPVSYAGQTGWAYSAYLTTGFVGDGPVTTGGQQGEVYVADGPVNFRTGPSTDDGIISVIPNGALVALNGDSANGFVSIIYTDQSGWAHAASIFGTGEEAPAPVEAPAVPETPPAPEAPAVPAVPDSVPVGDAVTGSATVIDGALNLRTGPGTDFPVVLVMPDAAAVDLRGNAQANFFPISYNGTLGWASADFLQQGGVEAPAEPAGPPAPAVPEAPTPAPETPAVPDVDGSDGYTEDEIIQIIYAAADAYGQPREDMLRVARCESVLDPNAVNTTSQASGLFQFLPGTWQRTPFADQNVFDPVANANATGWMWQQGNRNEWTCQ